MWRLVLPSGAGVIQHIGTCLAESQRWFNLGTYMFAFAGGLMLGAFLTISIRQFRRFV